jgi:hypothetical protein
MFETVALMVADPGPRIAHYAFALDTALLYQWVPNSTAQTDGHIILGHTGGYAGTWQAVRADNRGSDLTDADATIYISGKRYRYLPASTLGANHTLTISNLTSSGSTTYVSDGDELTITRLDAEAYTYDLVDAASVASIITLPASEMWFADLRFEGANWVLARAGKMQS